MLIVAASLFTFTWTFVHALLYFPDTEVPAPRLESAASANAAHPASLPSRILIPALAIDAPVQRVGVNAKGNMAAPSNFTDVAWYKYGTVPGMKGSAVMAGHVDNGLGLPGVFKNLEDIRAGDDVFIIDRKGRQLHFEVTDIEVYPYKAVPIGELFGRHDVSRLNLITCEGEWVPGDKTYDHRMVIYTELVS